MAAVGGTFRPAIPDTTCAGMSLLCPWRPRRESHPRILLLQRSALLLGYVAVHANLTFVEEIQKRRGDGMVDIQDLKSWEELTPRESSSLSPGTERNFAFRQSRAAPRR